MTKTIESIEKKEAEILAEASNDSEFRKRVNTIYATFLGQYDEIINAEIICDKKKLRIKSSIATLVIKRTNKGHRLRDLQFETKKPIIETIFSLDELKEKKILQIIGTINNVNACVTRHSNNLEVDIEGTNKNRKLYARKNQDLQLSNFKILGKSIDNVKKDKTNIILSKDLHI